MEKTSSWILYVEDDEVDHMLFENAIKKNHPGYTLKICQNGEEALKLLDKAYPNLPDIIFSDINMPKVDGFEFLKKLNNTPRFFKMSIPFIFLSNSTDKNEVENAFALKAKGFFKKGHEYKQYTSDLDCIITYWNKSEKPGKIQSTP